MASQTQFLFQVKSGTSVSSVVSAQGREGRGFDSACETNFLLFKNDLNLSA
jgi:hypothetical protein